MIPAFLIPLVVQLGAKLIEKAFEQAEKKPTHKKIAIFDKIEKKDQELTKKMREK